MVYFPARKCYHAAKIGLLLVLVVAILTLFERWRGGQRSTGATFSDPVEAEFERQILEDEARIIPGLGEGGVAAHLMGEDKRLGEESEKKLAMNVYLSDRISYNRTLKDYRNPACSRMVYDAELPSVSVILIFHNEPYSVVVRTVWSVVNSARRSNPWFSTANFVERGTGRTMKLGSPGQDPSSPFVYLKEIILVDDNSTLPELKGKLSHYVRTRLPPDLIRILRLPDRQGLMKARMRGARAARGDVLVFLDAHCEAGADWLRPLVQRLRHKRDAVLTPLIDVIDQTTFKLDAAEYFQVGGFTFTGHFTWIDVPEREKKRRGSDIAPTWTPTMAGGLFAINRAYYWEMGAYDEQMAGWGGENLEMSFRIWQCGGTLETIPCSRVGHVFRSFHPYGLPANSDTHGINTARMAEVWMDEYAELFYLHRPDLRNNPKIGDVTHRRVLREKLKCKSFQWYLDNIYKEKFVPVRDVYGYGRFMNPATGFCLDTMQRDGDAVPLGAYPCHSALQATQYLSLSLAGQLRDEEKCAQLQFTRRLNNEVDNEGRKVLMANCHEKQRGQKWKYDMNSGSLRHVESDLCLSAGREAGADVKATACAGAADQRWTIDYAEYNQFTRDDVEPSDRDIKLKRLRGQKRISRSLLSYDSNEVNSIDSIRRKSHKSKRKRKHSRTKNKFIVKLVRTLGNGSEEHLEVDIHCKHHQLYPNNTFVRDLVTILNDKDIKVINNGRVFEKNKVTELVRESSKGDKKVLNKLDIQESPGDLRVGEDMQKRHRSKKHKRLSTVHAVNIATTDLAQVTASPGNKRIIIEDFVAVRPAPGTRHPKKHKRGRASSPAPPAEAPPSSAEGDTPLDLDAKLTPRVHELLKASPQSDEMTITTPDSIEDSPMLGSAQEKEGDTRHAAVERDGDIYVNEDWLVGMSRFRGQSLPPASPEQPAQPLRRRTHRADCTHQQTPTPNEAKSEALSDTDRQGGLIFPEAGHLRQRVEAHARQAGEAHSRQGLEAQARQAGEAHTRQGLEAGETKARRGADGKPVRLVMRTNLTFNLGDSFFKRAQQLAQANEVTDEQPPRAAPASLLLVAAPPAHAHDEHAHAHAHAHEHAARAQPRREQDDSADAAHLTSSSSESAED